MLSDTIRVTISDAFKKIVIRHDLKPFLLGKLLYLRRIDYPMRNNTQELVNDISRNLSLTFTIVIFFVVFIRTFIEQLWSEAGTLTFLGYSGLVGIYAIIYVAFSFSKSKIELHPKLGRLANSILIINLGLIGLMIAILLNVDKTWAGYFAGPFKAVLISCCFILPSAIFAAFGYIIVKHGPSW